MVVGFDLDYLVCILKERGFITLEQCCHEYYLLWAGVVKGYMRDPGQQGDGDDIHTLLPPPYRLGAVDTPVSYTHLTLPTICSV